ncbi:MAG TPA: class I SAM-dependent methyltransferase [Spirochaetota bacterium]|nr:class I SAM-dependent methyltransferase [Spirochaetota bacterium]
MEKSNSLYFKISEYYDYAFGFGDAEKNFYSSLNIPNESKVLEIGCGTGNLTKYLREFSKNITGIDIDDKMIEVAKKKYPDINFMKLDALEIDNNFDSLKFDYIFCMGNTLVHLENAILIESLFNKVRKLLKHNGEFIFQILNYDKIIDNNIKELALIENDKIIFERKYEYSCDNEDFLKNNPQIIFATKLIVKENNKIITAKTKLYPIKSGETALLLEKSQFRKRDFYGNFSKEIFNSQNSDLLIGKCSI